MVNQTSEHASHHLRQAWLFRHSMEFRQHRRNKINGWETGIMKIERYDMIVIGAGPAGLSAAIEAAKKGLKPIVFDENAKPGGQLFNKA